MPVVDLSAWARDVILRDGTTLRLRPPTRADADELVAFFRGLSTDSLYTRFHGIPTVGPRLVEHELDPDWIEHGALVGTLAHDDDEPIVSVASYARLRDPAVAEVAFAVAEDMQARGVGTRLLEQLAGVAAANGIASFVAEVLPSNRAMLAVFADAGFAQTRERESGVIEVRLSLRPTVGYLQRVDQRDHVSVVASLRPFFEPASLAVIGASRRRGTIGGELFRNVIAGDFAGAAYPVNPRREPVAGVRSYAAIDEIPEPVDLAVIAVPGDRVIDAAEGALRGRAHQ